jgi:hypothetical protein
MVKAPFSDTPILDSNGSPGIVQLNETDGCSNSSAIAEAQLKDFVELLESPAWRHS